MQFFANNPLAAQFAHIQPLAQPPAYPGYLRQYGWLFDHYVILGQSAVALFFLVSGFVIPMSLERLSPGRFAVARIMRIYPVWLVSLAIAAVAYWAYARWFVPQDFPLSARDWALNASLLYEWFLTPYVNPVVWTLAVEIKFYLLCGVIAWLVGLHRALPIVGLCTALAGYVVLTEGRFQALADDHWHLFIAASTIAVNAKFLIFLFIGVCFYNLFRGSWDVPKFLAMTSVLGGLYAAATLTGPDPEPFKRVLLLTYAIAFVLFLAAYVARARLPYSRAWNYLCDVSYPLYAVHYLVGMMLLSGFATLHDSPYLALLATLVCVFAIVAVVHRYVEEPAMRWGKQFRLPALPMRRTGVSRPSGEA